jgi:prepilin-type N-terminal cleavage/methylation domain-containing protein
VATVFLFLLKSSRLKSEMKSNKNKNKNQNTKGFTLLEILLVVAAIGILAGIVIVAINPGKQLGETRNTQRKADINTILNAVYQYAIDHSGNLPAGVAQADLCDSAPEKEICKAGKVGTCSSGTDLSVLTNSQTYLVSIPTDPSAGEDGSGYHITKNANGRVTVCAPNAELSASISVTR